LQINFAISISTAQVLSVCIVGAWKGLYLCRRFENIFSSNKVHFYLFRCQVSGFANCVLEIIHVWNKGIHKFLI
jgi:hypothetical protein